MIGKSHEFANKFLRKIEKGILRLEKAFLGVHIFTLAAKRCKNFWPFGVIFRSSEHEQAFAN